jgi:hypothetical protein
MSATCPRPGLAQVCDGSATGLVGDPGQVWSGPVDTGVHMEMTHASITYIPEQKNAFRRPQFR